MTKKRTFFVIITFLFILVESCIDHKNPRTVYWSGSSFHLDNESGIDSMQKWIFYLGYYIEVSDTGDTKLMTRKEFNAKREYYLINLADSVKDEILELSADKSSYSMSNEEPNDNYSGFSYSLKFKNDTIERTTSFIPIIATPAQKKLYSIFNEIWKNHMIIRQTTFETREYEKTTALELNKLSPPPPLPKNEQIKFPPDMMK